MIQILFMLHYNCVVKFSFNLELYFSITNYTKSSLPFHSTYLNPTVEITHYLPVMLYDGLKILKP